MASGSIKALSEVANWKGLHGAIAKSSHEDIDIVDSTGVFTWLLVTNGSASAIRGAYILNVQASGTINVKALDPEPSDLSVTGVNNMLRITNNNASYAVRYGLLRFG